MSVPTEFDFAIIQKGDGGTPTEVFTILCGIQDVTANFVANSNDRFVRDCAKPGSVPTRKTTVTGKQLDVSGSGLTDKATATALIGSSGALGKVGNYKVLCYTNDGSDTGVLLGTIAGAFLLTASNYNMPREDAASLEVNLASHGDWTWTAV